MKRPLALLAATALASSLFAIAPAGSAQAVPTCDDPNHPIDTSINITYTIGVGTTKTQKLNLEVSTHEGCDVTGATAKVKWPHGSKTVKLHKGAVARGRVKWTGQMSVSPKNLRNSDSGRWPTTFTVTGAHTESLESVSEVRRAARLSFNAGPEPVRNGTITYAGKLERASWNSKKYNAYNGSLEILRYISDDAPNVPATLTTSDGAYRLTQPFPGGGYYTASYAGDSTTAAKESKEDQVVG